MAAFGHRAKDGTATVPAYSFANDTDTGLYRADADTIGVAGDLQIDDELYAGASKVLTSGRELQNVTVSGPVRANIAPAKIQVPLLMTDKSTTSAVLIPIDGAGTEGYRATDFATGNFPTGTTFELRITGFGTNVDVTLTDVFGATVTGSHTAVNLSSVAQASTAISFSTSANMRLYIKFRSGSGTATLYDVRIIASLPVT